MWGRPPGPRNRGIKELVQEDFLGEENVEPGKESPTQKERPGVDLEGQVRQKEWLYSLDPIGLRAAEISKCKISEDRNGR